MNQEFASLRTKLETAQNWLIRVVFENTNNLQVPARLLLKELWHLIAGLKAEKFHDFCMCWERFVSCFTEESLPPGLPTVTEIFQVEKVVNCFSSAVIEGTIPFQFRYPTNTVTIATVNSRCIVAPIMRNVLQKAEKLKDIDFEKCRGTYFNVVVEIIGLFRTSNNFVILRVWDGTKIRNPSQLYSAANHIDNIMYANKCHMENVPSEYIMDITVHDDAIDKAEQYQAGDIVAIANLHNYHKPGGGPIWPTLHSIAKGRRFDRGFHMIPPSAQQYRELHKLTASVLSGDSPFEILNDMCGPKTARIRIRESQLPKENMEKGNTEVITIEDTPDIEIAEQDELIPTTTVFGTLQLQEPSQGSENDLIEGGGEIVSVAANNQEVEPNKENSLCSTEVQSVVTEIMNKVAEEPKNDRKEMEPINDDPDYASFVKELTVSSTQMEETVPRKKATHVEITPTAALTADTQADSEDKPEKIANPEDTTRPAEEKDYTVSEEVDTIIVENNKDNTDQVEPEELTDTLPPKHPKNNDQGGSSFRETRSNEARKRKTSEDVKMVYTPRARRSSRLKKLDIKAEAIEDEGEVTVVHPTKSPQLKELNIKPEAIEEEVSVAHPLRANLPTINIKFENNRRSFRVAPKMKDVKQEEYSDEVQVLGNSAARRSTRKRKTVNVKMEAIDDVEISMIEQSSNQAKRRSVQNETRNNTAYTVSEEVDILMEDEPIIAGNAGFKSEQNNRVARNKSRNNTIYTVSEEVDTIMEDEPIISGNADFKTEPLLSKSDTAQAQLSYDGIDEPNSSLRTFAADTQDLVDLDLSMEELDNTIEPTTADTTVIINKKKDAEANAKPVEEYWKVLKEITDNFVKTRNSKKIGFRWVKNDGPLLQFVPAGTFEKESKIMEESEGEDSFDKTVVIVNPRN